MNNIIITSSTILIDIITPSNTTLTIAIQGVDLDGLIWRKFANFNGQDALDTWNSWGSDDSSIISKVLNS